MLEVADIFRLHGPAYRAKFGDRMLPSHRRAMQDIEQCRTAALGGQVYFCAQCQDQRYSYHSCKNRNCPKCGNEQANEWLNQQQNLLLPTHYFLVTFTLPQELRPLARSNQKTVYQLLFRASSQALLKLAQDPRFVGGQIGMVGVLQTWTRDLHYHPHIHYIVTGGGLTPQGTWRSSGKDFLVHEKPLAIIFRAKLRDELKKCGLFVSVDQRVWKKDWVVDCEPVGNGSRGLQVSRALHLPRGPQQSPPPQTRPSRQRYFPVQRISDRANQVLHPERRGVHPPLSPARPPSPLRQSSLLRPARAAPSPPANPSAGTARRCQPQPGARHRFAQFPISNWQSASGNDHASLSPLWPAADSAGTTQTKSSLPLKGT